MSDFLDFSHTSAKFESDWLSYIQAQMQSFWAIFLNLHTNSSVKAEFTHKYVKIITYQ